MARYKKVPVSCTRCDRQIISGATFCSCGEPTKLISVEDRIRWELQQWRAHVEATRAVSA